MMMMIDDVAIFVHFVKLNLNDKFCTHAEANHRSVARHQTTDNLDPPAVHCIPMYIVFLTC